MAKLNSDEMDRAHKKIKAEAKQRVVERGLLQFRADPETVKAVLQAADKQNMPVGALLRQWIQDRLMLDTAKQNAPDLVQRVTMLEDAIAGIQKKLK